MTNEELEAENKLLKQQVSILISNLKFVLREPEKWRSDMERYMDEIKHPSNDK